MNPRLLPKTLLLLALPVLGMLPASVRAQQAPDLQAAFQNPPETARPWVFWYWMNGAVTAEGITADLQAMKEAGIGGAYLMPIKDVENPPAISPPARQLSPQWWAMVKHAMQEADRLGLKLAMHISDGFDCDCACRGEFHGEGGPQAGWFAVSETLELQSSGRRLSSRLIERRAH